MANPQPGDAHIRVALEVLEQIMMRQFSKRQRAILDLILRLSWGCGKKVAYIQHLADFGLVGVHRSDVRKELQWLTHSRVILWEEATVIVDGAERTVQVLQFNKDYDQWQVSPVREYDPDRMKRLVALNLDSGYAARLPQDLRVGKSPTSNAGPDRPGAVDKSRDVGKTPTRGGVDNSGDVGKSPTTPPVDNSENVGKTPTSRNYAVGKTPTGVLVKYQHAQPSNPHEIRHFRAPITSSITRSLKTPYLDTAEVPRYSGPAVDNLGDEAKHGLGCFLNHDDLTRADLQPHVERAFDGQEPAAVWPEVFKVLTLHCRVMKDRDWCQSAQPAECFALVRQALDELAAARETSDVQNPAAYLTRITDRLRRMESDTWSERRARLRPAGTWGPADLASIFGAPAAAVSAEPNSGADPP